MSHCWQYSCEERRYDDACLGKLVIKDIDKGRISKNMLSAIKMIESTLKLNQKTKKKDTGKKEGDSVSGKSEADKIRERARRRRLKLGNTV